MNRKCRADSTNIIALAAVCMVLLTSIVGTIANQTVSFTNKRSSAQVEQRDLGTTNGFLANTDDKHDAAKAEFKPDELLIKFRTASASSINSVTEGLKATILNHFRMTDVYHIRLPENLTLTAALDFFRNNAQVEYAEPNYVRKAWSTFPNDPYFDQQWALHNTLQAGVDISALTAWDVTTGSNATVTAVIDTGIDYTHPDLAANMWRNLGEIAGNGIDDDHNGYVDDVYGIDTYNGDSDPIDDFGHGTHCAGIIGAAGNNGMGIASVNWNASIMALKFVGNQGYGSDSGAIECIDYAIMMKVLHGVNVRVLSNSWGGDEYDQALYDAIQTAGINNILFVAAAGNSGSNNGMLPVYPASYDLDNIIAVAATDYSDLLAEFSSWGPKSVDVGAPGDYVLSTMPTYHVTMNDMGYSMEYSYMSGTSMACPHVAGVAALILALHQSYSCNQVRTRILSTVDVLPSLSGKVLTDGRINATRALTPTDNSMHVKIIDPIANFTIIKGAQFNVTAWIHTVTDPVLGASVQASFSTDEPSITLKDEGVSPDRFMNDGIYTAYYTPAIAGTLTITFNVSAPSFSPTSTSVSGKVRSVPTYVFRETTYQWVELSQQSIGLCLGDDNSLNITSPFPVNFYGETYSNLTISSNGNIDFENKYLGFANAPIPSANHYGVDRLIAVFWDDMNMRFDVDQGAVYCSVVGDSPSRSLVVEWKDVARYPNIGSATFEVLFNENSSNIVFQYHDVSFENSTYDYGANAAIGIQYSPEWGTQFSYRSSSLGNNYALMLSSTKPFSLESLTSEIIQDPAQTAYYVRTGNIYDDSALGFIYGKSVNAQNIIAQWNSSCINQSTGKPLFSGNLVAFGGTLVNKVVNYYEQNGIAKVGFDQNSTHYMLKSCATNETLYAVAKSTYNPSAKDYFVIQAFKDGSRTVLTQWGISAQGTYASGLCFADLVWLHIADFEDSYYIYSWNDLNGDGIPTTNEMLLRVSGN
jgi:subtilisin family serine protease